MLRSPAWWLNRARCRAGLRACVRACGIQEQILLSKPSAVPHTVHMEGIKVRHGAKARNGALVLIVCVSAVTRRGHGILGEKKARKIHGAC